MRLIIALSFIILSLFAEEMKITSKYFHYDMAKKVSVFKEDVNVTKGKDNIVSNELKVYFNKDKKPIEFIATGKVKFTISIDKNTTYKGTCNKLTYKLNGGDIILVGNAKIVKTQSKESVKGNKIILNRYTKNAEVIGGKKPVEIILKVNE